jgi:hypothetical protein
MSPLWDARTGAAFALETICSSLTPLKLFENDLIKLILKSEINKNTEKKEFFGGLMETVLPHLSLVYFVKNSVDLEAFGEDEVFFFFLI